MMVTVIELFGGIGAFTEALRQLNLDYKIEDYVEIDKFAVASYNAINNTKYEPRDIQEYSYTGTKDIDIIIHGSPCQDFSTAGRQAGGDQGTGTKSSLMYESIRIIKEINPKIVIWENVKNLLSKRHVHNFENYLKTMEELGYTNHYKVLNAKEHGIPQNRERVFTISIRTDSKIQFSMPEPVELTTYLTDILEDEVDDKYYVKSIEKGAYARKFGSRGKIQNKEYCDTLVQVMGTGGGNVPLIVNNEKLRKLTPKECWRLMGFTDQSFEKARAVNSDSQLYRQAGNSIVENVLKEIIKKIEKYERTIIMNIIEKNITDI